MIYFCEASRYLAIENSVVQAHSGVGLLVGTALIVLVKSELTAVIRNIEAIKCKVRLRSFVTNMRLHFFT